MSDLDARLAAASVPRDERDPFLLRWMLGVFRPFHPLLRALGVDPRHVSLLLQLRLRLRLRMRRRDAASGWNGVGLLLQTVLMLLLGVFIGLFTLLIDGVYGRAVLVFTVTLPIVLLNALADFGEAMSDRAEADLVLPTPVEDRAVLLARLAQLSSTMGLLVAALGLGPLLFGLRGADPAVWLPTCTVGLVLTTMLSAFLVVLVYMLALRLVGPQRFRGVIAWIQIGGISAFYFAFYIGRPLLEDSGLSLADLGPPGSTLHLLWPPCWFASLGELLDGHRAPGLWAGAGLSLVVPPVLLGVALRLSRSGYLQSLAHDAASSRRSRPPGHGPLARWGRLVCRGPRQLAGYDLTLALIAREPGFRVRAVPSIVLLAAIGLGAVLRGDLPDPRYVGLLPYLFVPLFVTAQMATRYGESPEGARLAAPTPGSSERSLRIGVIKALVTVADLLPSALVTLGLAVGYGPGAGAHAAVASVVSLAACVGLGRAFVQRLPFSEATPARGSTDGAAAGLVPVVLAAALAGLHLGAATWSFGPVVWGLVGLAACAHQLRRLERLMPAWKRADDD